MNEPRLKTHPSHRLGAGCGVCPRGRGWEVSLWAPGDRKRGLLTPAPKGPVLVSGRVSLQFEKLGYSQPWIQVPTSWVYLRRWGPAATSGEGVAEGEGEEGVGATDRAAD